jgi:hypothetical protein
MKRLFISAKDRRAKILKLKKSAEEQNKENQKILKEDLQRAISVNQVFHRSNQEDPLIEMEIPHVTFEKAALDLLKNINDKLDKLGGNDEDSLTKIPDEVPSGEEESFDSEDTENLLLHSPSGAASPSKIGKLITQHFTSSCKLIQQTQRSTSESHLNPSPPIPHSKQSKSSISGFHKQRKKKNRRGKNKSRAKESSKRIETKDENVNSGVSDLSTQNRNIINKTAQKVPKPFNTNTETETEKLSVGQRDWEDHDAGGDSGRKHTGRKKQKNEEEKKERNEGEGGKENTEADLFLEGIREDIDNKKDNDSESNADLDPTPEFLNPQGSPPQENQTPTFHSNAHLLSPPQHPHHSHHPSPSSNLPNNP